MRVPTMPEAVARTFAGYPEALRTRLTELRALVFDTSAAEPEIGPLEETLKWGEPAYLTRASRSGSTLRLGPVRTDPAACALYVNCNTVLVDTFRSRHPGLDCRGNREVRLTLEGPLPRAALAECIVLTLTYHRWKAR